MSLSIGRKGQLFLKKETTFNTEITLAATNFMRHIDVGFGYDPFQRVTSGERKTSPGAAVRFDRRTTANLGTLVGLLRPSGVLNTLAECDPVLEAAFGSKTNVTLSTTVASDPSVSGATLASAAGLVVGDAIVITRGGVNYIRILASVAGSAVTWAPNLPTAAVAGDVVKGATCYKLTTDLAISLTILHSLPNFKRELLGAAIDSLKLDFGGTDEARFTASGPAASQMTGAAQAVPGTATAVGGNPPTGMVGELYIGNNLYLHKGLSFDLKNGLAMRNEEAATSVASEVYRAGRREITVNLDAFVETEETLYDLAEAGTNAGVFRQNGRTAGNMLAVYAPKVEWKVPDTSNDEGAAGWGFTGMALESADGANDELYVAFA